MITVDENGNVLDDQPESLGQPQNALQAFGGIGQSLKALNETVQSVSNLNTALASPGSLNTVLLIGAIAGAVYLFKEK